MPWPHALGQFWAGLAKPQCTISGQGWHPRLNALALEEGMLHRNTALLSPLDTQSRLNKHIVNGKSNRNMKLVCQSVNVGVNGKKEHNELTFHTSCFSKFSGS